TVVVRAVARSCSACRNHRTASSVFDMHSFLLLSPSGNDEPAGDGTFPELDDTGRETKVPGHRACV
ncbi:MAG: hypothetical protein LUQ69_08495, partial [Methanoregulaceae archaeon]|nr:hypothetical protein [Methanoregulaceae archaeon]